jgi:hypothetical protein
MGVGFAGPGSAQEPTSQDRPVLKLVQTVPLLGVNGRLDHMAMDLEHKRLLWPLLITIHWKSWT